jgi:hypothetical protein
MTKSELREIISESPLYDPCIEAQDIEEIAKRNNIEVKEKEYFLENYIDAISIYVVITSILYFGAHLLVFFLKKEGIM